MAQFPFGARLELLHLNKSTLALPYYLAQNKFLNHSGNEVSLRPIFVSLWHLAIRKRICL